MTQSDQTKNYKIDIYCFSAKHAALRSKSKDWLLRNQNVSDSSDMSTCGLLFQWASTIKNPTQRVGLELSRHHHHFIIPPQRSCRGAYWFHHIRPSVRPSVDKNYPMSYDNLSSVSQNVLKFYQQLIGEERRIPFIFDGFHFCLPRVIGLDMTKNRMFTLCRMITWVVFLRMFWNFISSLSVKRGGSFSFLTIFTFAVPELLDLIWRKIGFLPDIIW
jgi:hypothetical protein